MPRYLDSKFPILNPRILARWFFTFPSVLKKTMQDFSLFIIVLEASVKVFSISVIRWPSFKETYQKSIMSSTN